MDFLNIVNDYINKLADEKDTPRISGDVKGELKDQLCNDATEKKVDPYDVNTIVEKINNGTTIQEIAKELGSDIYKVRLLLMEHKYRYDILFNWWTKLSRDELLDKVEKQLESGQITFDDLKQQKIDVKYVGNILNARKVSKKTEIQPQDINEKVTKETSVQDITVWSKNEYEKVQEIIKYWEFNTAVRGQEKAPIEKFRIDINLSHGNYDKLQMLSELLDIPKEHIVNQAIHQYLEKLNKSLG